MFEFVKQLLVLNSEERRKQAQERKLRQALSEKLSHYQESPPEDKAEYIQVMIGGRTVRVEARYITLADPVVRS